jgi:hypothetical protein
MRVGVGMLRRNIIVAPHKTTAQQNHTNMPVSGQNGVTAQQGCEKKREGPRAIGAAGQV